MIQLLGYDRDSSTNANNPIELDIFPIFLCLLNICFFLMCVYDVTYITFNFSKTECIDQIVYIYLIVISVFVIIEFLLVLLNSKKLWKFTFNPMNLSFDDFYNIDNMLDRILLFHTCITTCEFIASLLILARNRTFCSDQWFNDVPNTIFYMIRWLYVLICMSVCVIFCVVVFVRCVKKKY